MKKLRYILLIFICLFAFSGCTGKEEKEEKKDNTDIKADYELNKTFKFMTFEVTVKDKISIVTIKKDLSADNNKKVIKLPVTVKNIGSDKNHLSMFYYKFYNSSLTELSSKGSNFDDSLDYATDLKPGESYEKNFYIPYEGKGKYVIEFNNFSNKYNLVINVDK